MTASLAAISLIKQFEGCRLVAYLCPAGVWTIGWGHTANVVKGQSWSQAMADWWLGQDVAGVAQALTKLLGAIQVRQCEFDALVSLCYNLEGGPARLPSQAPKLWYWVQKGDAVEASQQFLDIDHAMVDGVPTVLPGLTLRRQAEARLYLSGQLAA
jgi:GH24 family phage-related lysozyme (muramidase)